MIACAQVRGQLDPTDHAAVDEVIRHYYALADELITALIVAQPGAGKTRAGSAIGDSLGGAAGYVPVDSDHYKPFHPDYDRLLRTKRPG
jgi:hypothetical protein